MNDRIKELKKLIMHSENQIKSHLEIMPIIDEIKAAKANAVKYHTLQDSVDLLSPANSAYYLLTGLNMDLCGELIELLFDKLAATMDIIDQKEAEDYLLNHYDFKVFNASIIWDYLEEN